jgi:ferric-dicitrate binding protein FerR (iron transport regulator)
VIHNFEEVILKPGEYVSIFNNEFKFGADSLDIYPSWTKGLISFKSIPYSEVLEELEHQFDIKIETQNVTIS